MGNFAEKLNLVYLNKLMLSHKLRAVTQVSKLDMRGGVKIARFHLATADGNTPAVRPLTAYVLPCNLKTKPVYHYLMKVQGCTSMDIWLK